MEASDNGGIEKSTFESTVTLEKKKPLWKRVPTEMVFFSCIASMSVLGGFGMTLTLAKRKDPKWFSKGLIAAGREIEESGGSLALRALGRGSFYAVGGFSLFCIAVWKLSGVNSTAELREKLGKFVPSAPRQEPQGRNDFTSLRELVNYLIDEDQRTKSNKK